MSNYRATQRYASSYFPGGVAAGEVYDLDADVAEDINRDAPGTLEPVVATPEPEVREVKAPPHDRMVRPRNDRGRQESIDKSTYKAVKGDG